MGEEIKNYTENIHNEEYKKDFCSPVLTAANMFYDKGREKESLNGCWNFQIDPYDTFLRSRWYQEIEEDEKGRKLPLDYDFEHWEKTTVPSCWNLVDDRYLYYEGAAIYTRKFEYSKQRENRVFLKIGAANYETRIFLNRSFLGYHRGGSTPFYVEITEHLEKENRLIILVDNKRRPEFVPMSNTDWFNYGGLYRDVELIRTLDSYLKDITVQLSGDNYDAIKIKVEVDGLHKNGMAEIDIPELGLGEDIRVKDGLGESIIKACPELWTPDNPRLYEVNISYRGDQVREKLGFRDIRIKDGDIYLNGEKIFFRGVACHEESFENGRALTEEEIRENFRLAREMNCNFLRLAHYPHTGKAARIADEMGLMLWEEIPVYWAIDFSNPETIQDAENQLKELIKRDKNRASVLIWSVGNENPDTDERLAFMKRLALKTRELDPTRPVSAACLVNHVERKIEDRLTEYLDIIGINEYYGWYDPEFDSLIEIIENSKPDKPVFITEFGAAALAGHRGAVNELFTEDNQQQVYRKQVELLGEIPYIKGLSPWILYDFRCPRRTNRFQRGYNLKGLLSRDKKHKKLSFYIMKEFYEKLKISN
ncbi:MAG TPA: glycoside hydrolase family 2 TIM barrel-domain containing protein [Halanaerobiales bacterium]|nr:glycoside hydrolase family 2 TIM barrel-domain containing protein [Halanaerobiales bacterium]